VFIVRQAHAGGDILTSANETRSRRSGRGNRAKGEGAALIAAAALQAFAEKGYHGISIRELAQRADVSLSTMYWFYPSKQDLLFALIQESVRAFAEIYAAALAETDDDPVSRLDAFVGALVEYRARYQRESKVLDETRSLEPPLREKIDQSNEDARNELARIIAAGIEAGVFRTPYPDDTRRMLTAACNAVARWYDPAGQLTIPQLITRYRYLARTLLGCADTPAGDGSTSAEDR
jgi:AcrR family transcriptional regulator